MTVLGTTGFESTVPHTYKGPTRFALVLSSVELRQKVCLRSYDSPKGLPSDISVVDAMLATCASNSMFAPVTIGRGYKEQTYIGADLGASNPAGELISEAHALFGADSKVAVLLSLGSGHSGTISMPIGNRITINSDLYRQILSDSEVAANEIQTRIGGVGIYFRLSVRQGMQGNESMAIDGLDWISTQASSYMKDEETIMIVSKCVQAISDSDGWISLEKLSMSFRRVLDAFSMDHRALQRSKTGIQTDSHARSALRASHRGLHQT
jgi:hypothetical protein